MKCYFKYSITGNKLSDWNKNRLQCKKELLECNEKIWIDWPEKGLYSEGMEWKIVPICYCVPSDNIDNMIWLDSVYKFIPTIYNFVKSLKNVRTALISRMSKNVKLKYHQGWACVANHVLRCHLPILVENNTSGVVVDIYPKHHREGDYILFDDSIRHYGFNNSNFTRYVLIIDFKRPSNIQKGISNVSASDELTKLCSLYNVVNKLYDSLEK